LKARGIIHAWLACALVGTATVVPAQTDEVQRALGQSIFMKGLGRDGREITGGVGAGDLRMRSAAVACANCHGAGAGGGGERFAAAPDIRWYALSAPYGAARGEASVRPAYDARSFARAVRVGVAPDGVRLDPAMPRFDLADDEVAALIAYLELASAGPAAKPAPPALVLLLPAQPDPQAERLLAGLQTCPQPVGGTAAEGPPGTRVLPLLRVVRYDDAAHAAHQASALGRRGEAAALLAPYLIGRERAFVAATDADLPPVLFPIELFDAEWPVAPRFSLPGLEAQALALVSSIDVLRTEEQGDVLAILADETHSGAFDLAQRLLKTLTGWGWDARLWSGEGRLPSAAVALLALAPLPPPPRMTLQPAPRALLLPAAFAHPEHLQGWQQPGTVLRLALPYSQGATRDGRWISPVQAWIAIGCELMARLPPLPTAPDGLLDWQSRLEAIPTLELAPWLSLPVHETPAELTRRVVLIDWTP